MQTSVHSSDVFAEKIRKAFNTFDATKPEVLDTFYAQNAVFQDPAIKVSGLDRIRGYYLKVYKNVTSIRFDFHEIIVAGNTCTCPWTMTLAVKSLNKGKPYQVEGVSIIRFNDSGLVEYHRDYVDFGAMVYERIPIVGKAIELIRKGMAHGQN